jgi:hypothetical protein
MHRRKLRAITSHHPTPFAEVGTGRSVWHRLRLGAHARYAIHQTSRSVLEIVALLHNLVVFIAFIVGGSVRSPRNFDSEANTFRSLGDVSL